MLKQQQKLIDGVDFNSGGQVGIITFSSGGKIKIKIMLEKSELLKIRKRLQH